MTKPNLEAVKEVARWLVLFIISWVITETLKQTATIPEWATIKVWVFVYAVPVRSLITFGLTFAGRYADKYIYEKSKQIALLAENVTKVKGLLPF